MADEETPIARLLCMTTGTRPTVAISGATSFSGLWIARAFREQGWAINALCARPERDYAGLRAVRLRILREAVPVHFDVRAETGGFERWISEYAPTIWIHHHHFMDDFRSPSYDTARASRVGLLPLPQIVAALKAVRTQGIIFSGTFFEPGEGGRESTASVTPYARSKRLVWDSLAELAGAAGIRLSKIVMPNPVGPLENDDRLVPSLIRAARAGETFRMRFPTAVADYLPIRVIATKYVEAAGRLLSGDAVTLRPSGTRATTRDWVERIRRDLIESRLGLSLNGVSGDNPAAAAVLSYQNPANEVETVDWDSEWQHYAHWLEKTGWLK